MSGVSVLESRAVVLCIVLLLGLVVGCVLVLVARRRRRVRASSSSQGSAVHAGLGRTRSALLKLLNQALGSGGVGDEAFRAIEEGLLAADVGPGLTETLVEAAKRAVPGDSAELRQVLKEQMHNILRNGGADESNSGSKPHVVLVVGVNGVGKTTTVGKLAARHAREGKKVMVVAADTFRAAAIEQLEIWAKRAKADFIRQQPGGDPAAVVFDGMRAAVARGTDIVLVDTAGRLHTKRNLMEELRKLKRVVGREVPGAPHETLLVLDATTGQNGLAQARAFLEALEVSGVIVTKLDGTAKGGVVLAVKEKLGIPIRYVGVGEGVEDLRRFDAAEFVEALLGS